MLEAISEEAGLENVRFYQASNRAVNSMEKQKKSPRVKIPLLIL
jgi:hypothetical protein